MKSNFERENLIDGGANTEWKVEGFFEKEQQEFLERIADPNQSSLATLVFGLDIMGVNIDKIDGLSDAEKIKLKGLKGETTDFWRNPKLFGISEDKAISFVKEEIIKRLRSKIN